METTVSVTIVKAVFNFFRAIKNNIPSKDRYRYLDENTRIAFGWHFAESGESLQLQKKEKSRWRTKAYTYPDTHKTLADAVEYLLRNSRKGER